MRRRRVSDNPTTAECFADLKAGYSAAKQTRFRRRRTGLPLSGGGADYHYRSESDWLRMLEYARDFDRNDVVISQLVDRAVTNIVQDGIQLDPQTGDEGLDKEQTARWQEWGSEEDQCDLAGETTWAEIEELVTRHVLVDGDMLLFGTRYNNLELIEAHRLRTPRNATRSRANGSALVHGVLINKFRRPAEYWVTKDDVDPSRAVVKVSEIEAYPARDEDGNRQVFHVKSRKRVSQTRGISAFAPVFDVLGMFEDLNFATLVRAQISACAAVFRERAESWKGPEPGQKGEQTTETLSDGSTRLVEGMSPGMEIPGAPGETLKMDSPNVPAPEFFPHVKLLLTLIGINLGMPLVLVLLDASETNFTGWRASMLAAYLGFRRVQRGLIRRLHRPIYTWKTRRWVSEDNAIKRLSHKSAINPFRHRWNLPSWPYSIQPLKDAQANLLRVRTGQISPRRLQHEQGRDWQEVAKEIVEDNLFAIRKAKESAAELNKEMDDGQAVHWRELLSLPTPDGVKIELPAIQQEQEQ